VPISLDYAKVNGIRLHYARAGHGQLILFAHGFPEFWFQWRRQLDEFERDYLVVAPDLRGYNLSDKPAGVSQYEISYMVDDLLALAAHIGQKKFFLVGHDWGGVVCWFLAARHPEAVRKLVILNAPHPAVFARELRNNPAQQQGQPVHSDVSLTRSRSRPFSQQFCSVAGQGARRGASTGYFDRSGAASIPRGLGAAWRTNGWTKLLPGLAAGRDNSAGAQQRPRHGSGSASDRADFNYLG